MKRNILVAVVLLLAVSASGLAQQSNLAEAVFDKWRLGVSADHVSKLRFALATVTRRTSNAGDKVGLKIIIPVRPTANALEVKWVGYANGKIQNSHTIQVWLLRDGPFESLTRVTAN
jgi:hypothetical protein